MPNQNILRGERGQGYSGSRGVIESGTQFRTVAIAEL